MSFAARLTDLWVRRKLPHVTQAEDPDNRRDASRVPIELKIEYSRLNAFFSDYTRDISKGGIFIQSKDILDEGTQFLFRLYVPGLAEPIVLHGEVRWVIAEGETGMGIQFLYADEAEREALELTVERLMNGSMGEDLYAKLLSTRGGERR